MAISFAGISSGIDTSTIIAGLVSIEKNKQTLLKMQQQSYQDTVDAYGTLTSRLDSLKTAATTLSDTSKWSGTSATSTSDDVTATSTGSVGASLTFDVDQLAQAHSMISANSVSSTSTNVVSSGSLALTKTASGAVTNISVGTGSLSEVVSAINSADAGVTASVVQTSSGVYRLQIQSTESGGDSAFTLSGIDGFSSMEVLSQGQDASITVGTGAAQFTATSETNTFDDLVSGLSFTVGKVETGVTVASTVNASDASEKLQAFVDAANNVLGYVAAQAKWSSETNTGGPLMGESAARGVQQQVLSLVSQSGITGLEVTSDGTLSFNSTKFSTAFKNDPTGMTRLITGSLTSSVHGSASDTAISLNSSKSSTKAGTYAVVLSQAALQETWTAAAAGTTASKTFALTKGSTSVSYTAGGGETVNDTITALNSRLSAAGVGITAALNSDGLSIDFVSTQFGSSHGFSVSMEGTTQTRTQAGQDVAGTIDGVAASGLGQYLSLSSGSSDAVGLSLKVESTAADITATGGAVGSVTYRAGLGLSISQLVSSLTDSTSGAIATAKASAKSIVDDYQDQIEEWSLRLTSFQDQLTREFMNMETMISSLKSQQSALTSLLTS